MDDRDGTIGPNSRRNQITEWQQQAMENMAPVFDKDAADQISRARSRTERDVAMSAAEVAVLDLLSPDAAYREARAGADAPDRRASPDLAVDGLAEHSRQTAAGEISRLTDKRRQLTGTDFIDRLKVFLRANDVVGNARPRLTRYFGFRNNRRTHYAFGSRTPDEVYFQSSGLREAA